MYLAALKTAKKVSDAREVPLSQMIRLIDDVLAKLGLLRTTEGSFIQVQEQRGELIRAYEFLKREPNFISPPMPPKVGPVVAHVAQERTKARTSSTTRPVPTSFDKETVLDLAHKILALQGSAGKAIRALGLSDSPDVLARMAGLSVGSFNVFACRGYKAIGLSNSQRPDLGRQARRNLIQAAVKELDSISERLVLVDLDDVATLVASGYRLVAVTDTRARMPTHRLCKI